MAILEVDGGDFFAVENIDQENHAQLIELKGDLGGKDGYEIQDVTEDKNGVLHFIVEDQTEVDYSDGNRLWKSDYRLLSYKKDGSLIEEDIGIYENSEKWNVTTGESFYFSETDFCGMIVT